LDPGESGSDRVCYRVRGNPGRVWLRASVTGSKALAAELELEAAHGPEDAESQPLVGRYTPLRDVVAGPLGRGVLLSGCRYVGKLEVDDDEESTSIAAVDGGTATGDDTYRFWNGDLETEVRVEDVVLHGDGEFDSFDLTVVDGAPLCKAIVSGGRPNGGGGRSASGSQTYRSGCTTTFEDLHAPHRTDDDTFAISNVELYACADACVAEDTRCIRFDWRLPADARGLGGESLRFDLEFRTVQCRHDPQPTNPW
jgi:hypothetical protein